MKQQETLSAYYERNDAMRRRVGRKLGEMADRVFDGKHLGTPPTYTHPTVQRWLDDVAIASSSNNPVLELHRLISERGEVKCQAILDFATEKRCLKPATENDERFRHPLCGDCAEVAWNCMAADADMLANAY